MVFLWSYRYEMDHLKGVCVKKMLRSLNEENVCKIARIASRYEEEGLVAAVKKAITDNLRMLKGREEYEVLQKEAPQFLFNVLTEDILSRQGARACLQCMQGVGVPLNIAIRNLNDLCFMRRSCMKFAVTQTDTSARQFAMVQWRRED